jgi:hypothetical protein
MAKRRSRKAPAGTIPSSINTFDKGLNTDVRDFHLDKKSWTKARNAINNSHIGDLYAIGNEPSNRFCSSAPYKIIGNFHMVETKWWVFSGNDLDGSEIGIFDEKDCSYTKVVNDPCLGFRSTHPITGASRPTWDCSDRAYWQDNLSPDRTLDRADVPWIQDCVDDNGNDPGGCVTCTDTDVLDCDKIRLEIFMLSPCARIERGPQGGTIFNGTYYVHVAYLVDSQRVTDYFPMSNVVHIFEHNEANASLDITVDNLDTNNFDQYELVLVQHIANKMSAKRVGIYSTNQDKVTIDLVDPTLESVDPDLLILSNPIADRSEGIFNVGKYLFRTGITGKFDFNYQPLANQIRVKWQAIEYPEDYYKDGGSNVGYARDEQGAFFVRFRYHTGDITPSYHIPGRVARNYEIPTPLPGPAIQMMEDADYVTVESNNIENQQGLTSKVFEMFNTASGAEISPAIVQADGGELVAEGDMGYWESDEFYPDQTPEIWNATYVNPITGINIGATTNQQFDLCGKRIRHHKFPENTLYAGIGASAITNHYVAGQKRIRVMGVAFDNIQPPVDNFGVPIQGIAGYEILRGSRDGNRTVLYKGLINNMRQYDIPETLSSRDGVYPNYPFNGGTPDLFNSSEITSYEPLSGNSAGYINNGQRYRNYRPLTGVSPNQFTFHSPDTMFNKPFLGQKELKFSGIQHGAAESSYIEVDGHPKHVFVTDLAFIVGAIIGIGYAISKYSGQVEKEFGRPTFYQYPKITGGGNTSVYAYSQTSQGENTTGGPALVNKIDKLIETGEDVRHTGLDFVDATLGWQTGEGAEETFTNTAHTSNQFAGRGITTGGGSITYKNKSQVPKVLQFVSRLPAFVADMTEAADLTLDIIRKASNTKQFALQYQGYCGYEDFAVPYQGNRRRLINESVYLGSHLQNFKDDTRVNNILRAKTVMVETQDSVSPITGSITDTTMSNIRVSDLGLSNYKNEFIRNASSHYVAMKTRLRSQYGQVYNVQQVPASNCVIPLENTSTGVIFGGDTYIGRYQEKNTFYHFYQWLLGQADRAEFNYHLYDTLQHTAFWMDTDPFDVTEFIYSIPGAIASAIGSGSGSGLSTFFANLITPSDKACFDKFQDYGSPQGGVFTQKNAFMYLFHSSVRDFFVESDLNIDMRDWEDDNEKKHWAALQDLRAMFHPKNIRANNYYRLDRSLSVATLPFSKVSWGSLQDREYNPQKAETCYTYYPKRLQYSLPQQELLKRDNWSAFLGNNFKDFTSNVTTIKGISTTGIMLLFQNQAPGVYPGVDELQLKSGTSITVGDGGLFARQMQRYSNADKELEYGSCQSRRGAVNTPHGLFYLSQDQGKAFKVGKGLQEMTVKNNKYWFNQYLPIQITQDFPDYDLLDNPVAGVGCQALYDNEWGFVYFCKRDFRVKPEWKDKMIYEGNGLFLVDQITRTQIGNPIYFDDASWTVSFDADTGEYISHHDWHPNLHMSGKNTFLTIKDNGIWRHNDRCDSFCNFYGRDYPFEIEFQIDTTPAVVTVRSVEYLMQVHEFADNCRDRFHVLDFNFDEAIIYNSEQVSGLLKLNIEPKNDVRAINSYPIVGLNDVEILYSKEEQKYRFNQFWDVTRDRGEYGNANETIWYTQPNGYITDLNPNNLNYVKHEFQRKKFRHNNNRVLLRRTVSGNKKMLLHLSSTKVQNSPR